MNEVDRFVEVYNEYLKEKERNYSDVRLIARKVSPGKNENRDLVTYFLRGFEFPRLYNYSGFAVSPGEVEGVPGNFTHFATHMDYNLLYVHNPDDQKIYLWDFEQDRIEWVCAENSQVFFHAMSLVMETKLKMLQDKTFELDPIYLKQVYEKCMELNGSEPAYSTFYEHILNVEV